MKLTGFASLISVYMPTYHVKRSSFFSILKHIFNMTLCQFYSEAAIGNITNLTCSEKQDIINRIVQVCIHRIYYVFPKFCQKYESYFSFLREGEKKKI